MRRTRENILSALRVVYSPETYLLSPYCRYCNELREPVKSKLGRLISQYDYHDHVVFFHQNPLLSALNLCLVLQDAIISIGTYSL